MVVHAFTMLEVYAVQLATCFTRRPRELAVHTAAKATGWPHPLDMIHNCVEAQREGSRVAHSSTGRPLVTWKTEKRARADLKFEFLCRRSQPRGRIERDITILFKHPPAAGHFYFYVFHVIS